MKKKSLEKYNFIGKVLRAADKRAVKITSEDFYSTEYSNLVDAFVAGANFVLKHNKGKKIRK